MRRLAMYQCKTLHCMVLAKQRINSTTFSVQAIHDIEWKRERVPCLEWRG